MEAVFEREESENDKESVKDIEPEDENDIGSEDEKEINVEESEHDKESENYKESEMLVIIFINCINVFKNKHDFSKIIVLFPFV